MHLLPSYNVHIFNVFLPITFDFPGPKDDFDLSVRVCAKICAVQVSRQWGFIKVTTFCFWTLLVSKL